MQIILMTWMDTIFIFYLKKPSKTAILSKVYLLFIVVKTVQAVPLCCMQISVR